ncbi:type IV pilus biogenesis protein PilP [Pseudomonas asturiensis]|uniref:type IV pilus biogenesis protein PilP n=1 Tax=Pseudomonas asturiensis TaxID=1190415 RepID=UPI0009328184|nr:type IV pilus biogenesis protein PilP [Pseudomonas asturiensis]
MQSRSTLSLLVALVGYTSACLAAELSPSTPINIGVLSEVQSETILLQARAEKAKAERSLNGDVTTTAVQTVPPYPPEAARSSADAGVADQPLPVVTMVSGSTRAPQATLLYSGGFEIEANTLGAELPGGYKLAKISLDGVVLTRAGKMYPLGFSSRAPQH